MVRKKTVKAYGRLSEKYRSQESEKGKTELPVLLFIVYCTSCIIATLNTTRFVLPHKYMNPMNIATVSAANFE